MGEAERAHALLKDLLGPQRTYPNMFDAHPLFQIDGNFGGAAGILEMLVQSWGGEIRLLPALPAAWTSGQLRGIHVRGGIRLDMNWAMGKLQRLELDGPPRSCVRLHSGGESRVVTLSARGKYRLIA